MNWYKQLTRARNAVRRAAFKMQRVVHILQDRPDTYEISAKDYIFDSVDGKEGIIQCAGNISPRIGDYIILEYDGRNSRYRIINIIYKSDKLWDAKIVFAPRTSKW